MSMLGKAQVLLAQQKKSLTNGFERENRRSNDTFAADRGARKMRIYFRQRQSGEMQKVSRKLSKHCDNIFWPGTSWP